MENILKNAFKEDELEKLLVTNWTKFIDSSKLMAFVLQTVKTNSEHLEIISSNEIKQKGVSLTISRFKWTNPIFVLWVEFHVPLAINKIAVGTMELNLSNEGILTHTSTSGNIIFKNLEK